jgi:CHAT domain-containing protein/tetratricopeptide (TPR) repeat protein
VAELLAGSPDKAVRQLVEAATRAPDDASILSDLAAAYLARAEAKDDPRDLVWALAQALAALKRDGSRREALFNKALALENLGLERTAAAAWRDVLRSESDSGWTGEARVHCERLERAALAGHWSTAKTDLEKSGRGGDVAGVRAVVVKFSQATRLAVQEEMLPLWAAAHLAGRSGEARAHLALATATAHALRDFGGDGLLADTVEGIAVAQRKDNAAWLALVATGFAAYGDGVASYKDNRMDAAISHFERARRDLGAANSPFSPWADVYLAICDYQRGEYDKALTKLDAVLRQAEAAHSKTLKGRDLWIEGLVRIALAQPADALRAYRLSLASFESAGERESAVALHALIADALGYASEEREGWRHRYYALRGLRELQSPRRRHAVLGEAAMATLRLGIPESALCLQEEAVRIARRSGNPLDLAEALRGQAAIELQCREPHRTIASLSEAKRELRRVGDPDLEQAVTGELLDLDGQLRLARDPGEALRLFTAATAAFQRTAFRARLAESYLHQAWASLALRDTPQAESALESGISSIESEWQWTLDHKDQGLAEDFGSAYTERLRQLFDEMLRLLSDQSRIHEAFDYAERLHNWGLLDQALRLPPSAYQDRVQGISRPVGHQTLLARIPAGTAIIEYAQLEDRLIAWTVQRDSLRMTVTMVSRQSIDDQVNQFYRSLAAGRADGSIERSLTALHSLLVKPILPYLHVGEILVFVPDHSLSVVPFSALYNVRTRRLLIQDSPLTLAPSATVYLQAAERNRTLAGTGMRRALVFGDPTFDSSVFPDLSRLSEAANEATGVAALYPEARLLLGSSATRERFLALAGSYPVVHLAAHARTLEGSPLTSVLVLAANKGSGAVYAHELLQLRFLKTRLLVLSVCSSAGEDRKESPRISGFVRPLLAAGIPAIIGTLWQVNDRESSLLMKSFHERYRQLGDAPVALRAAQLQMIEGSDSPLRHVKSWAGFQAYGAAADPP